MSSRRLRSWMLALSILGTIGLLTPHPTTAALRVWGTDDPDDAQNEPSDDPTDPWVETDANNEIPVNLAPGDDLFIASWNNLDPTRSKFWNIRIEGPLVSSLISQNGNTWYDGFQTPDDTAQTDKSLVSVNNVPPNFRQWQLKFSPQPHWERIRLSATAGANGKLKVTASSVCTDTRTASTEILFADTSVDSPRGVAGSPSITEILLFPVTMAADIAVLPTFVAPPTTGIWESEFVAVDPEGNPRPLGVRFFTPGPGIGPDDRFDAGFSMLGAADDDYVLFVLEGNSGAVTQFDLFAVGEAVPTLPSGWGYWVLTAGMVAIGALAVGARRSARAHA